MTNYTKIENAYRAVRGKVFDSATRSAFDAAFNESDHPRAENGQFGANGGSDNSLTKEQAKEKYDKLIRLANGMANTNESNLARKKADEIAHKYELISKEKKSFNRKKHNNKKR
jgi:hypothetical protein